MKDMKQDTKDTIKKELLEALERSMGVVKVACDKTGHSRNTYYKYYNDDEDFKTQVNNIKEGCIDFAEAALLKQIKGGNAISTIFYLKTQGKKRGYVEKHEYEDVTPAINLKVDLKDKDEAEKMLEDFKNGK